MSKNLKLQLLLLMCLLLLSLSAEPNFTTATMVNRVPCTSLFCVLSQNGESLIRLVESFGSPVATLPTSTTRVLVVVLIQGQSQEIFFETPTQVSQAEQEGFAKADAQLSMVFETPD